MRASRSTGESRGFSATGPKLLALGCCFVFATNAWAGKAHKAHSHGQAKLSIVVESAESKTATLEFESPAEAIYGFEHEAKSQKDKDRLAAGIKKFEESISKMVKFDEKLKCVLAKVSIDPAHREAGEKHSEVRANYTATCEAPLAGSKVTFGFAAVFPGVKLLEVQALTATKQNAAKIKKDVGAIDL